MATQTVQKILRVGIIQNGRIIEERLLRNREAVTVGQKLKNTFVIASNEFPGTFTMFDVKAGKYVMQFTDRMSGRMLLGDNVYDLGSLKQSGKARKGAAGWSIQLSERARGKLVLGDVTILFQFVNPPPLRVLPQLPANMRGGILLFMSSVMGLSGGFLASLVFSFIAQVGAVLYLVYMVPPAPRIAGLEELQDRFVQILAQDEEEPEIAELEVDPDAEGVPVEGEVVDEAEPAEDEGAEEPAGEREEAPDTRTRDEVREDARQRVRQESALAAFYGGGDDAEGPSLGFTDALTDRRADEVLANQTALGANAGSGGIVSRSGLGTSSGAEGEVGRAQVEGGGSRVAEAAEVGRADAREGVEVRPTVRARSAQTRGAGELDENNRQSVLRRGRRHIERCYERGLARDPALRGRLVIQFTVGEGGRVTDARLRENSVSDSVGTCIIGQVRRWRFDEPEGGRVVIRIPYILEPAD